MPPLDKKTGLKYRTLMGLFRRSKQIHEAANPLEAAAESKELGRDGVLGPNVFSVTPVVKADPGESDIEN